MSSTYRHEKKGFFLCCFQKLFSCFPSLVSSPVIKRKRVLVPTKHNLTHPVSKVNLYWRWSFLEVTPMCHVLLSRTLCCIIYYQIWPLGLLSWPPPQPPLAPDPACLSLLQFVGIMRPLPNLHSNMKSTRGIIPMDGTLSEWAWTQAAQLWPCSRAYTGQQLEPL